MGAFIVPVAVVSARRRAAAAVAWVLAAAFAGASGIALGWLLTGAGVSASTWHDAGLGGAYYGAIALVGAPLGAGLSRRWSCTRIVTVAAVAAFAVMTAMVLLRWDQWHAQWDVALQELQAGVQEQADSEPAQSRAMAERFEWLREHGRDLEFGLLFGTTLWLTAAAVAFTGAWLRRSGEPAPEAWLGAFKTPDWLVWPAIVAVLAIMAESRWPQLAVQRASWNTAMALAAAYTLNGLAIVVYAMRMLGTSLFAAVALLLLVLAALFVGLTLLTALGLMDTWVDFRRRIDALRAHAQQGGPPVA